MTESSVARKPGRPRGSSRHNEADVLRCQQVAEKVLQNPSLTDRAAILQVLGTLDTAGLRRLQDKFQRQEMVAAARARVEAAELAHQVAAQRNLEALRLALDLATGGPSFQKLVANIAASPFMQSMEQMRQAGVFDQAWIKVQQSPFMQSLEAMQKAAKAAGGVSFLHNIPNWPALPGPGKRRD